MITELSSFLEEYQHRIQKSILLTFYTEFANSCMIVGDFQQSLQWTAKLLNDPETLKYHRTIETIKWLNVINHFELGHDTALESAIRSAYRYLRKREVLYGTDKLLLSFIKRVVGIRKEETLIETFQAFYDELQNVPEISEDELIGRTHFDILSWLRSKIENTSLAQILYERRAKIEHEETPVHA